MKQQKQQQQANKHNKKAETKVNIIGSEINVTFPPEGSVFTGELGESHSRPSGKVRACLEVPLSTLHT